MNLENKPLNRPQNTPQTGHEFLPMLVAWEITRSCVLSCAHCRASAHRGPYQDELTTAECLRVLDEIAAVSKPILILTGGEPLLRPDVFDLARRADDIGLRVVLASCGTLIDAAAAGCLVEAGVKRVSISLDGATAETHDSFRGVKGAFDGALRGIGFLKAAGMEFQINTTVTRKNVGELEKILELSVKLGAVAFHPFLLVPTGRGKELAEEELDPSQYEEVLGWIHDVSSSVPLQLKPTCAPHYHRIVRQAERRTKGQSDGVARAATGGMMNTEPTAAPSAASGIGTDTGAGCGDSRPGQSHPVGPHAGRSRSGAWHPGGLHSLTRGCMGGCSFCFISHVGEVQICGFLDTSAGNVKTQNFAEIWTHSPFLLSLRNFGNYRGRCGYCEFRNVCGGCRARAFAVTGDYLGEEPFCSYVPRRTSGGSRETDL